MTERVQKILAQAGVGSRRHCEALIQSGRVTVNGRVVQLGQKADARADEIRIDGRRIPVSEAQVYLALNKPKGVLASTRSQGGLTTVIDLVDIKERVYPVGRLDADSEGLVLLTNDGMLANRLTHPRYGHTKEYLVTLNRVPDEAQLDAWRRGVVLADGYRTRPARVTLHSGGKSPQLRVELSEGRKRQIRETANSLGLHVKRLIRVRIASLELGTLAPGAFRHLSDSEINRLKESPGRSFPSTRAEKRKQPSVRRKHDDG